MIADFRSALPQTFDLTDPSLVSVAVALGTLALAWAAGWATGKYLGTRLADWWSRWAGARGQGLQARICNIARYAAAAAILTTAVKATDWPTLAAFLLGVGAASYVALLVWAFARGLHLPRWAAGLLAVAGFAGTLSDAVEGLRSFASILDQVGLSIAGRSITLLDVVQVAIALLILVAAVRLIGRVLNHSISRAHRLDSTQKVLAQKLAGLALVAAAFFVGIDLIGIDLTALAVFSGAVGLAIGFGLQKTFGNLIAGIILLMDRSIKPGDVISVGDSFGAINKIGVRAVSIVTRDGKEHLIPNENLMTQEVVNWSYSNTDVRVHIPVGVAYNCDLAVAQRLMIEAAKRPARVLQSPAPVVWLRGFGDSSVDHEILVWIRDPESGVGNVQSEVLNAVWHLFQENGIEIPFPQRDIHVRSLPDQEGAVSPDKA